jgi:hypothetical protein
LADAAATVFVAAELERRIANGECEAAIHRDADASVLQRVCEGKAGELRALIGVEDVRLAEANDHLSIGLVHGSPHP